MSKEMNVGKDHQNKRFSLLKISLLTIVALFVLAFGVLTYRLYDYEKTIALDAVNTYELTHGEEITEITIHHVCYIMPHMCHSDLSFNDIDEYVSYGASYWYEDDSFHENKKLDCNGSYNKFAKKHGKRVLIRCTPGTRTNLDGIKVHYDLWR